jgi:hypothetical protein
MKPPFGASADELDPKAFFSNIESVLATIVGENFLGNRDGGAPFGPDFGSRARRADERPSLQSVSADVPQPSGTLVHAVGGEWGWWMDAPMTA